MRIFILSTILLILAISPSIFMVWDDSVDPPFISNHIYSLVLTKFLPVLAITLCIIFYLSIYSYSKSGTNIKLKMIWKSHFSKQGKRRLALEVIFLPVIIYGWFWASFCLPIKLWAFYSVNPYWSMEYQLIQTRGCGSDYEEGCIRLTILDLNNQKKHSFRWYSDSEQLIELDNKILTIIGEKGYFGYIVNGIEWEL